MRRGRAFHHFTDRGPEQTLMSLQRQYGLYSVVVDKHPQGGWKAKVWGDPDGNEEMTGFGDTPREAIEAAVEKLTDPDG